MENIKNIKYISLTQASSQCDYSQEYLSLRARQGKLKSVKIGRNWVTTEEWLKEYIKTIGMYAPETKSIKKQTLMEISLQPKIIKKLESYPPINLPVGEPNLQYNTAGLLKTINPLIHIGAAILLTIILFGIWVAIPYANNHSLVPTGNTVQNYGRLEIENLQRIIASVINLTGSISETNALADASSFWQSIKNIFNSAKSLVFGKSPPPTQNNLLATGDAVNQTNQLEQGIINDIQQRFDTFREDVGITRITGSKEGLVVVPSSDKDKVLKDKLSKSFSDEVTIEPQDETSGIIRPIFREVAQQSYIYMMVPLKN